jgi:hypothetical protein
MTGPPVGLFHPVFNEFEKNPKGNDPIPCEMRLDVHEFMQINADIRENEGPRLDKFETALYTTLFGVRPPVTRSENVWSDGAITVTYRLGNTCLLILELKNEFGTGGLDPFVQASFIYQQYWSDRNRT